MNRILVTGGPKTGKTTFANALAFQLSYPVWHTDELNIKKRWSEASFLASLWLDEPGPWIIEGQMLPRCLRKWLNRSKEGVPADKLYILMQAYKPLTDDQKTQSRGVLSILEEVLPELRKRGMEIHLRQPL